MSFPNVAEALWDWTEQVCLTVVNKRINDFEVTEDSIVETKFMATLEPMPAQALALKPEGERNWKWWTMWSTQRLANDTILKDPEGLTYRVHKVEDWRQGGILKYDVVEGVPLS